MAATVPFRVIQLNSNDVPGATLPHADTRANSVLQLRRYLEVHGVKYKKNSKKEELVQLVERTLTKKVEIDPKVDGGKWLERKSEVVRAADINKAALQDPTHDTFPIVGWRTLPSRVIPNLFCYGSVYKYIMEYAVSFLDPEPGVEDSGEEEGGDPVFATTKPFRRGRFYFTSGHVQHLEDAVSAHGHFCLKGKVRSSYKDDIYTVMVKIEYASGNVIEGYCHCKASCMARCSHVAAILLALEDYTIQFGYDPQACTSRLCEWNKGRQAKSSVPIYEQKYTDKRDPARVKKFQAYKPESSSKEGDRLKYACELLVPSSMWTNSVLYTYLDYELTAERVEILKILRMKIQTALKFELECPGCIKNTELQSQSSLWSQLRTIIITASACTNYLSTSPVSKKLDALMWNCVKIDNVDIRFGRINENAAREKYEKKTGFSIQTTGLWVNPRFPGLGASPDGIVTTNTGEKGLLEIKCSYMLRNHLPTNLDKLTAPQRSAFFLKIRGNEVRLSRSHKYYKQVQMQLAIVDLDWCDFAVWTKKDIFIERIFRDDAWWQPASKALLKFHAEYVCPEYFEIKVPGKLEPLRLELCDEDPEIENPEDQHMHLPPEGLCEVEERGALLTLAGCPEMIEEQPMTAEGSELDNQNIQEPMEFKQDERTAIAEDTTIMDFHDEEGLPIDECYYYIEEPSLEFETE